VLHGILYNGTGLWGISGDKRGPHKVKDLLEEYTDMQTEGFLIKERIRHFQVDV